MTEKQAMTRIASYCSKAERSEYDVRKKLTAWEIEPEVSNRIVVWLQKENFLNEERFIQSFIKDKLRFNKWGKNKIVFELRRKQIPDSLINTVFEALSIDDEFEEPLMQLLRNKIKTVKSNTEYERRMKLLRFAAGRGFSVDLAQKCLNKLLNSTEDDDNFF